MSVANTKAWIYCRVAHPDLFALESQEARLVMYAKQHGLSITGVISEMGKGISLHREGLEKVTHALETGQAKTLLVCNLSRICRRSKDMEAYLDRLEHQKITLICTDGTEPNPYRTIYRSLTKLASKG